MRFPSRPQVREDDLADDYEALTFERPYLGVSQQASDLTQPTLDSALTQGCPFRGANEHFYKFQREVTG